MGFNSAFKGLKLLKTPGTGGAMLKIIISLFNCASVGEKKLGELLSCTVCK